jgi:MEMO1 family protein
MNRRKSAVNGTFYPATCNEIHAMIARFNGMIPPKVLDAAQTFARALIVPHAGYIYSGFSANVAYAIAAARHDIKRIIVIGPSHRVAFNGASVARYEFFESPCGDLKMDRAYAHDLETRFEAFGFDAQLHHEHSSEVQMPLIGYYFKEIPVVEIVYGQIDPNVLAQSIEYMFEDVNNLVVISTDLSHFYTLDEANQRDSICIDAIQTMDVERLDTGCEACGILGVKALILAGNRLGMQAKIIDYRTSADASGDTKRVVGYVSALME